MIEKIKRDIKRNISEDRYEHTLRVVDCCLELAKAHGGDLDKTTIAALLHDSAKFASKGRVFRMAKELNLIDDDIYLYNKGIIHASLGAKLASLHYGIKDPDILNAIKYHTTGRAGMSLLEKIIFMGDYIEPSRDFSGIEEIRELAFKDLDGSLLLALDGNLKFLLDEEKLISKDTLEARNYFMMERLKKEGGK